MDPQKLPDENRQPQDTKNTPPEDGAHNDVFMSEESPATPGSVVIGGKPEETQTPEEPASPAVPSPSDEPTSPTPPAPPDQADMPAFMRDDGSSDTPPPSSKKKVWLIALIVTGAVLLLAGGAAALYYGFVAPNKPDAVLKTALVNSFSPDIKSVGFDSTLSSTTDGSESLSMAMSGQASQENGQLKQLDVNASLDALVTTVTFDLRSVDGKTFYAKVGGLAGLPELLAQSDTTAAAYAPLLSAIDEQWYEINQSLIKQLTGGSIATSTLTPTDMQTVASAYDKNPFLVVTDTLPSETIAGADSYHYKVAVSKDQLTAFVSEVQAANIQALGLTPEMYDMIKNSIESADLSNLSKYSFDVWIAKDSKLFTQVAFSTQSEGTTTTFTMTFRDYNEEFEVEQPVDAKSVLEVMNSFYQTFLGTDLPLELQDAANGISL